MIPARAILGFIDRLERENVCLHGFELREHGDIRAEGYYTPFRKGQPHRMYSVSKSMVSLAVGLLLEEGRLRLEDPIIGYFPDKLRGEPDGRLARLTLRDMLRMATCYPKTTYREGVDFCWSDSFFTARPSHEPGAMFNYDTSCSQVLGELCQRVSGRPLLAFLEERVFAPLGATDEKRWLTDPSGIPQGGSGLMMSLGDMAKVAQCVLDGGRGILPGWYVREATSCQIGTPDRSNPEERFGYGWQFWMTRSGWAMYGMGGQMAIACPAEGLLLCTIADTRLDPYGVQRLYDAFYGEIVAHLGEESLPGEERALSDRLSRLTCAAVPHEPPAGTDALALFVRPPRAYAMEENGPGLLSAEVSQTAIRLTWRDGVQTFSWEGFGRIREGVFPGTDVPCLTSAGMTRDGAVHVRCQLIGDAPCGLEMTIAEKGDTLSLRMQKSSDPLTNRYDGIVFGRRADP